MNAAATSAEINMARSAPAPQLVLPLDWRTRDQAGFLVSSSNMAAVRHLEHPATWPVPAAILVGPALSGRSLLGKAFAAATGGTVIDDAERAPDVQLFHAWNAAMRTGAPPLLMIAGMPPAQWPVQLPDLRSRLNAAPVVTIAQPDDALMVALIERHFAARGTLIEPRLPAFVAPRIERSYAAVMAAVDAIDAAALAARRRITRALARTTLIAAGLIALDDPAMGDHGGKDAR